MRFLLVDDSHAMRHIQRTILESLGSVEFAEAADGVEALDLISKAPTPFDLMLIDWPLIMLTIQTDKDRAIDAIRAGVNDYVVKPFTPEMLLDRVHQTLRKSRKTAA